MLTYSGGKHSLPENELPLLEEGHPLLENALPLLENGHPLVAS